MVPQTLTQHAKKVVSNSLGLVDFAIGLVFFVLNLPDGQVLFFGEVQITEGLLSILPIKKGFEDSWNDLWASTCYLQLAPMAGCKTDFLCTLHLPHEQKFINLPGWCGKGRIKGPLLKGNQAKEFKPETIQEQVKWCTSTLQQRNYYTTWQIARVTKIHKFFTSIVSTCSSSTSSLLTHFGYIS